MNMYVCIFLFYASSGVELKLFYGAQYYLILPFEKNSYGLKNDLYGMICELRLVVYYWNLKL
jgi:hypothetical protein